MLQMLGCCCACYVAFIHVSIQLLLLALPLLCAGLAAAGVA